MANQKFRRFIERKDLEKIIKQSRKNGEFYERYHTAPPKRVRVVLFIVLAMIVALAVNLAYTLLSLPYDMPTPTAQVVGILIVMAMLAAGAATYTYDLIRRLTNIITYTEFQSLMLSRGMSSVSDFVLIITDGMKSAHADTMFIDRFDGHGDHVEAFFLGAKLSDDKEAAIRAAIKNTEHYEAQIMLDNEGVPKKYSLTISPLPNLKGFVLLQGKAL